MDWQASELNPAWSYAFRALVRHDPACRDARLLTASIASWTAKIRILESRLKGARAFVCGPTFTLADVALGLSVNRWMMTPLDRPALPAIAAYYDRLAERPAFLRHGRNGLP